MHVTTTNPPYRFSGNFDPFELKNCVVVIGEGIGVYIFAGKFNEIIFRIYDPLKTYFVMYTLRACVMWTFLSYSFILTFICLQAEVNDHIIQVR